MSTTTASLAQDPLPLVTPTHSSTPIIQSINNAQTLDHTVVKLGAFEPVEAWTEEKRQALAAGIAEKLGVDPSAITITVTEP